MDRKSATTSAIWLVLGLMIGAFAVEVYREINAAEPKGMRAFWFTTIG